VATYSYILFSSLHQTAVAAAPDTPEAAPVTQEEPVAADAAPKAPEPATPKADDAGMVP